MSEQAAENQIILGLAVSAEAEVIPGEPQEVDEAAEGADAH